MSFNSYKDELKTSRAITKMNLRRCLNVSIFLLLFFPFLRLISNALHFDFSFLTPYDNYLMILSATYISALLIIKLTHIRGYLSILYKSFYILSAIILLGISHIFFIETGSLYFYSVGLLYFAIIPVFKPHEFRFDIPMYAITLASFIIVYDLSSELILQLIISSIIATAASIFKRREAFNKISVTNRLNDELSRSEKDPLTKLNNRRGLERKVSIAWKINKRYQRNVAVIMLDIDFFKSYNDAFGHPAGDRCIKQIGNVISRTVKRETDINARIGGEEFLIFIQDASRDDILLLSKRLQRGIEALQIPHANTTISKYVTVSIGAAQIIPSEDNDFNMLYKMADEALYKAKENGRNCIVLENVIFAKSTPRYVIDSSSEAITYQAKRFAN